MTGTWHQFVTFLLELIMIERRHGQRRTIPTSDILGIISSSTWCGKLTSFCNLRTSLRAKTIPRCTSLQVIRLIVDIRPWHKLFLFGIGEVDSAATAQRIGGCASVLLAWAILEIILAWSWHVPLYILVHRVGLGVHTDFRTISNL